MGMKNTTILEVCVEDAAGIEAAVAGGADRIELCAALGTGGITPSLGLMKLAAGCGIPTVALIRPRAGDFVYAPAEFELMARDIELAGELGLHGVAIGALTPSSRLDEPGLAALLRRAGPLSTTLHRAFDLVEDQGAALEQAIGLGFARILSSGGQPKAPQAIERLAALCAQAGRRLRIMPGSGIHAGNVAHLLAATGAREVHASCRAPAPAPGERHIALGFAQPGPLATSVQEIAHMKRALADLDLRGA
jgi:copper homeostasis protein